MYGSQPQPASRKASFTRGNFSKTPSQMMLVNWIISGKGVLESMNLALIFEVIEAESAARRAVNAERHTQLFRGAKDRMKVRVAKGFTQNRR